MKLRDNEKLSVEGNGFVQIRMHNGMIKKLDTWYVPGLQWNLTSVDALAK